MNLLLASKPAPSLVKQVHDRVKINFAFDSKPPRTVTYNTRAASRFPDNQDKSPSDNDLPIPSK